MLSYELRNADRTIRHGRFGVVASMRKELDKVMVFVADAEVVLASVVQDFLRGKTSLLQLQLFVGISGTSVVAWTFCCCYSQSSVHPRCRF
jgi:hypothetical protein